MRKDDGNIRIERTAIRIERTMTGYRIRPEKPAEQLAEDCAAISVCIVGLIVVMALLV